MRHYKATVSHFGHRAGGIGRPVAMKIVGTGLGEMAQASDQELTDTMMKYLKRAADVIVEAQRISADQFSKRIPLSLKVRNDDKSIYILGGGHLAPNAYPFDPPSDPPVMHPVWGHGPRSKWHWSAQPYRPFLEEGAELAGDRAAEAFADIIDEWAKEIGKDRP